MTPPIPLRALTPTKGLVIGGQRFPMPGFQVLTWHEHGVQFRAGEGFNKRRRDDVDLVIWHWTGGEGTPLAMVDTLRKRKYGIEFAIDAYAGSIYQFADPMIVDTADAGPVNHRSVGIEMVNYGIKSWDRAWIVPRRGADRPIETQRIHGKSIQVAGFRPPATRAARALAEQLSALLDIPRVVPRAADGSVSGELFSEREMEGFQGHAGHLHISANKLDPGTTLLADLFDPTWEMAA